MSEASANYQLLLQQARRLPARVRLQLAETLLRPAVSDEEVVLVSMRRLQPAIQTRFLELMDRRNAGKLSPTEQKELISLVARYEALLLFNTETLLAAHHPTLFTASGRLRVKELERALRQKSRAQTTTTAK